jgi:hypothetical protein
MLRSLFSVFLFTVFASATLMAQSNFEIVNKSGQPIHVTVLNDLWEYAPVASLQRNKTQKGPRSLLERPGNGYIGSHNGKLLWTKTNEISSKPFTQNIRLDRETYIIVYKTKPSGFKDNQIAVKVDISSQDQMLDYPAGTLTDPEPYACYYVNNLARDTNGKINLKTIYLAWDGKNEGIHPQEGTVLSGRKKGPSGAILANNVVQADIHKGSKCGTFRAQPGQILSEPEQTPMKATTSTPAPVRPGAALVSPGAKPQAATKLQSPNINDQVKIDAQASSKKKPNINDQVRIDAQASSKKKPDINDQVRIDAQASSKKKPDINEQVRIDAQAHSIGGGSVSTERIKALNTELQTVQAMVVKLGKSDFGTLSAASKVLADLITQLGGKNPNMSVIKGKALDIANGAAVATNLKAWGIGSGPKKAAAQAVANLARNIAK